MIAEKKFRSDLYYVSMSSHPYPCSAGTAGGHSLLLRHFVQKYAAAAKRISDDFGISDASVDAMALAR